MTTGMSNVPSSEIRSGPPRIAHLLSASVMRYAHASSVEAAAGSWISASVRPPTSRVRWSPAASLSPNAVSGSRAVARIVR